MHYTHFFDQLASVFDTPRCVEFVAAIFENDRWFDFAAFRRTAEYCCRQMTRAGLSGVESLPLKADGKTPYGDWVIPRAWDVNYAALSVAGGAVITDYRDVPCSLAMYSSPTQPGGITASVVVADNEEALKHTDLTGKLVLTRLAPGRALAPAVSGGAAGIVSDCLGLIPGIRESRADAYDAHIWDNGFQAFDDAGMFAFCLSPRKGDALREWLAKNPGALLHADVNTRRYDGEVHTVSGLLPGSDPGAGEILVYGHLYEPGAHDNASGCGLMLELATALGRAVESGAIPRPRRGIRFVMGWECGGSMGWCAAHPDLVSRTICAIVPDMVGSGKKNNTAMKIWHNPLSNGSYADALVHDIFTAYEAHNPAGFAVSGTPFHIGSDNILADPCFGIPTVALIMHPALSYHSSMDTMALIEPDVLHRNGIVTGAFLLYMANAGAEAVPHLSGLLECAAQEALRGASGMKAYSIRNACARALLSLERLLIPPSPPEGWDRVPVRTVLGTLTLDKFGDRSLPYKLAWNTVPHIPLFWANGKRTLWQIAELSSAERGETDVMKQYEAITGLFAFLEQKGYIAWR
jgi:hypothetical protein